MIAIVDYKIGNLGSVSNMLDHLNIEHVLADNPSIIERADKLLVPGVGSFDACIKALRASGLIPVLESSVLSKGKPLLGICVGAQILGQRSEEGEEKGLGWIPMVTKKLQGDAINKVPNIGWRTVKSTSSNHPLFKDLSKDSEFYFVHSYVMCPRKKSMVSMTSNHREPFPAAISVENIFALQFHPEKSHEFGKKILKAFAEMS